MPFEQTSLMWRNLVPAAALSGSIGSWRATAPLANIKTSALAETARSTTTATADTKIGMDHGAAVTVQVLWIPADNITSAGQLRVLRGTTAGAGDVHTTAWVNRWRFTPPAYRGDVYGAFVVMPALSARYTTLEISDAGNPAGYVELGQVLLGDVYTFLKGPALGLGHGLEDLSTVAKAEGGAPRSTVRRKLRQVEMTIQHTTDAEADALYDMQMSVGTHDQVVYLPSLTDAVQLQRYGFCGRLTVLDKIRYPYPRHRTLPIALEQWG